MFGVLSVLTILQSDVLRPQAALYQLLRPQAALYQFKRNMKQFNHTFFVQLFVY